MNTKIPAYLYDKTNIIRLILLTAFFALFFINVFQPFGSRGWYPYISDFKYFFFSSLIILTGMLVVVVSRMIMFSYAKKHTILYPKYAIWVIAEILSMSLFFSFFTMFIPKGGMNRDFTEIFHQSTVNTSLVILLPYSVLWLYFSWREKNNLLQNMNIEEQNVELPKKNLIAFLDEKGELRISIMLENLLYVESADNYATIHYLNKLKISHFLLRNSLKWIEENLIKETSLVRCHRSYIVNLDKVKVLRKTKDGIFLELEAENTPDIPVSKTYYERVMNKFSKYSV
ncbi:MAG: LytTR family DNA-binding domain-containing protein [Paludibacter sp.]